MQDKTFDPTDNITVIINSCDSYADILSLFFVAWDAYSPKSNREIIISSETKVHSFPARTVTYMPENGIDDWGTRIKVAINASKTDYVLITYDDFILENYLSNADLADAVDILDNDPSAAVVYLVDTKLDLEDPEALTNVRFTKISDKAQYKLNSSPAVWRKTDFIKFTKAGDTPWAWEAFGTYRTQRKNKNFYAIAPGLPPIYSYDNSQGGAIYRGKWVPSFARTFSSQFKYEVDWQHRGFALPPSSSKRSNQWKFQFLLTGFKMVGFRVIHFIFCSMVKKYYGNK